MAEIDAELKALQAEREAVRAAEVQGVIARIRQAIEHYGLNAEDLGFPGRRRPPRRAARAVGAPLKAVKERMVAVNPNPPKYADGTGKTWTGRGKRPAWFVEALAAGRTVDDLLIKPAG